jgi:hypothetical protein
MSHLRLLADAALASAAAACSSPAQAGPPKPTPLDDGRAVLQAVSHDNLTLFPVIATVTPKKKVDYLVLDEGMKKKLVVVKEAGDGGDVNNLTLVNTSDRPLFLMAGEVVIGGKQDRIIGKNTIVAPRTTESVPVFCVEHGRWNGRKADFQSAEALAHTELRKKASFANQGEVWAEVSAKNAKRKVSNDTDTYRRVAKGTEVSGSIAGYEKAFAAALAARDARQIGFVVAIDGKVVAIETFGTPDLFRKFEKKLLRSYYVEAVDHENASAQAAAAPKPAAAAAFAARARAAKPDVVLDKKAGKTLQFDGDVKGSEVVAPAGEAVYQGAYE